MTGRYIEAALENLTRSLKLSQSCSCLCMTHSRMFPQRWIAVAWVHSPEDWSPAGNNIFSPFHNLSEASHMISFKALDLWGSWDFSTVDQVTSITKSHSRQILVVWHSTEWVSLYQVKTRRWMLAEMWLAVGLPTKARAQQKGGQGMAELRYSSDFLHVWASKR